MTPVKDETFPLPCPVGFYCPTGYAPGIPIPCPAGQFSSIPGAETESCENCPENTYNNLEGQAACQRCGTSSTAGIGMASCTCVGANRIFQFSDGACICIPGFESFAYEGQDESTKNKKGDCLPMVNERCDNGLIRDSMTRKCITVEEASENCRNSGVCGSQIPFYDKNYGTCFCPVNTIPENIENCCEVQVAQLDKVLFD